jgi:hypothetical protein
MTPSPAFASQFMASGWPHIDRVIEYRNATEESTLTTYAQWWAANHPGPIVVPSVSITQSIESNTPVTPRALGGDIVLTLSNPYYPLVAGRPTFSGTYRLIGLEVSPNTSESQEEIKILVETDIDPTDIGA